jgi:alpha/beta superfamily hydrolase
MTGEGAFRLVTLELPGPAGPLEALLEECDGGSPGFAALVCHPHPLYGGTMHNKVVHSVAAGLCDRGGAALRFNFRGVGKSAGRFDQGRGELEDARAALAWLRSRFPGLSVWLAGFSFGAWVAARLAASEPDLEGLVLVAPPVVDLDFGAMRSSAIPKLVLQGSRDEICPVAALEPEFAGWAEPKGIVKVDGATHFFDRQLEDLSKALLQGLSLLPPRRSS